VPTQNSVEFAADGTYKVCIKLTDFAANSPVFGHSASFDLKRAAPTFTSLDLVGDVVDGYVSSFDRQAAQPIAGNLDALNYDSVGYKLVTDSTPCDQSLTYGAMPTAGSADFGSDGNYKICVRLNDVAGNPSEFGSSPTFALKTSNPSFASINLLNAAQDSYLNAAERALSTPIVDEAQGSLFDHAAYKVVASNITCDASLIYGSIPTANSADITTDGSYKVLILTSLPRSQSKSRNQPSPHSVWLATS
jgi:hypothetical protein